MQNSRVRRIVPAAVDMVKVGSFSEAVEKLAYLAALLIGVGFLYLVVKLMGLVGIGILGGSMIFLLILKLGFLWILK